MEQAVKQRLVGAAVLTAIAVITLPMIFDTERPLGVQVQETMPPAPEYPAVAMPEPKPVELPADRPTAEPVPVSDMYAMNNDQPTDADSAPIHFFYRAAVFPNQLLPMLFHATSFPVRAHAESNAIVATKDLARQE